MTIDWQAIGAEHPRVFTKTGTYMVDGFKVYVRLDAHQHAVLDSRGLRVVDDDNAPPMRTGLMDRLALAGFGGAR